MQVEIVAVFFRIAAAVAAGEVIVQQQRVDPLVPLFRGNITARALLQRRLRHADVQLLMLKVELGGGFRYGGKGHALLRRQLRQVREGFGIDPHLFQTRGGKARRQPGIILAAFCRFKVHVFRGDQLLIQININVIFTRGLAIALFEMREIGHRVRVIR